MNPTATPPAPPTNKPLWAAIAVLGLAVLAMGATLIRVQSQPLEPQSAVSATPATLADTSVSGVASAAASPDATVPATTATGGGPASLATKIQPHTTNVPLAQMNKSLNDAKNITSDAIEPVAAPRVVLPQNGEPAVARVTAPARVVCATCGTVETVTAVEVEGTGSGAGAIAGGVLGAVVGNQVGGGDGKTLATILGAVGGGMAGNVVEKKMKKVTQFDVTVRMDDGSRRTLRQATSPGVGSAVVVNGDSLQPATR